MRFIIPLVFLLAFGYTFYGVYLHWGPQEFIVNTLTREELYIAMGGLATLMAVFLDWICVDES